MTMSVMKESLRCPICGEMTVEMFVDGTYIGLFCTECGGESLPMEDDET
jgi:hypothetical protein